MKPILVCIVLLILISCKTTNSSIDKKPHNSYLLYSAIVNSTHSFNDTASDEKVRLTLESYNPTEVIFRKLRKELINSDSLIYLFVWKNDMPTATLRFSAIVFDKSSARKYYCYNTLRDKTIKITTEEVKIPSTERFVLNKYLSDKSELLKLPKGPFSSSEIGESFVIYETDSISHPMRIMYLPDVFIAPGLPEFRNSH